MAISDIDAFIAANGPQMTAELEELCSFESISNHGEAAVRPCREWLGERLARLTDRVEVLDAGGIPTLYAEVPGAAPQRLLLYQHYDVQPIDPLALWQSPPFRPDRRDGRIFARGVCDDKADVMARIHALEALRAVRAAIPLTVRLAIEGEEEIGSRNFDKIVEQNSTKFEADGCLWESDGFNAVGRPEISFGVRGLLYVELRVRSLNYDQQSWKASLLPSAAAYLIEALASLRSLDMDIQIAGFYDNIVGPTEEDRRMMAKIDLGLDSMKQRFGYDRLIRDPESKWAVEQLLFMPTCNIAGLTAGYQESGSKTVLPAEASAKIDFRLIPNQDPADILVKLRRHFLARGFDKVEIVSAFGERPARSNPRSAIGAAVIASERELYGSEPVVWPFMAATGPMHVVINTLGIPTLKPTGVARPDTRIHAPNENIAVDDYINTVRLNCRILERFAAGGVDA